MKKMSEGEIIRYEQDQRSERRRQDSAFTSLIIAARDAGPLVSTITPRAIFFSGEGRDRYLELSKLWGGEE